MNIVMFKLAHFLGSVVTHEALYRSSLGQSCVLLPRNVQQSQTPPPPPLVRKGHDGGGEERGVM